jgi:ribosomal protein S27AE
MTLFTTKVETNYLCPRCGQGKMVAVSRPVNVIELYCETCESILSVDYVRGWHDARAALTAQPSAPQTETCEYCDTPVSVPNFAYHICIGRKRR